MTETLHTRSRRASLFGLLLQLVFSGGVLALAQVVHSAALSVLAWYMASGVLIWFGTLLVFRQRELAALEALDLEELRREKRATGGGDAIFDQEGGGALGFRVSETRLRWMQRWLIPVFGLIHAAFLTGMGLYLWFSLHALDAAEWLPLTNLPIAMIVLAVVMLIFFLFSRYASGMGRVAEWQLLRACGSYMLGNALAALAVIVCFGVYLYAEVAVVERVLAYALCSGMVVLAIETVFSFVLDIYRPRMRDVESRACFDSRLLALIAEPGGIASTIAEAMNYQFGFEVSQTWFYQLLQRTFAWLLLAGALVLWLLTSMVVVQPGERAIIERFGEQRNAEAPYEPGFYWKWPWPFEVARKYDTGRLHQIVVGFDQFDAEPVLQQDGKAVAALWTDERHFGQRHFNLLVPVPASREEDRSPQPLVGFPQERGPSAGDEAYPVNVVRVDVAVQYRISPQRLARYTQSAIDPHDAMLNIAWEEVVRYVASWDIFALLGEKYGTAGAELRQRIARRVQGLELGFDVVYVGMQNVHPETTVAKEFRKVISAEQEKIAAIRESLVKENEVLSAVAGDRRTAQALARAIDNINPNTIRMDEAGLILAQADAAVVQEFRDRFAAREAEFTQVVTAQWRLDVAREARRQVELDFELGLGGTVAERAGAAEAVELAAAELAAAEAALEEACAELVAAAGERLEAGTVAAMRDGAAAHFALRFWNGRLEELLPGLQGEAAAILADAQARRWASELGELEKVARLRGEGDAYRAAPRIYKVSKYLEVLVNGIRDSRKFFLAFNPGDRQVRVRYLATEQAGPEAADFPVRLGSED